MIDKQIIDGIDVSKCQHYGKYSIYCYAVEEPCSDNPNCYFKQLARAREEIKKLKKQIENEKQALQIDIDNLNQTCLDLNQENDDLQNKLQAKEQECEELKRKYNENLTVQKQLQEWQDEDLRQIKDLKQTTQELNESIRTCNVEKTKLYQKLSKIKEFCKELMYENEEYISINQVLQIIRGEE